MGVGKYRGLIGRWGWILQRTGGPCALELGFGDW